MRCVALAVLAAVALIAGCERKREDRGAPAGKAISPPAVEPLPAPRSRGQLASPASTPPEPARDAGADGDAGTDSEALTE